MSLPFTLILVSIGSFTSGETLAYLKDSIGVPLRVMSFNTWNFGANVHDGLRHIADHIRLVNPDIVALQEVESNPPFEHLLQYLGPGWSGFQRIGAYPDTAILTRHFLNRSTIVDSNQMFVGAKITVQMDKEAVDVNVWSVHTDWRNYGPYAGCNKLVSKDFQIEAGEYNIGESSQGRVQNLLELGRNGNFTSQLFQSDSTPMLLVGDFNSPSHLDWTERARVLHCDRVFNWPVSKLVEEYGFKDSYRTVFNDPLMHPGPTWSTVQKSQEGWGGTIPEPQDRIDFVYFKGAKLKPIQSTTYEGSDPVLPKPYHANNTWPSDHFAVISDFKLFK